MSKIDYPTCRITGYFDVQFITDVHNQHANDVLSPCVSYIEIDYFKKTIKINFLRLAKLSIYNHLLWLSERGFVIGHYQYDPCDKFTQDKFQNGRVFSGISIKSYVESEDIAYNLPGVGTAIFEFTSQNIAQEPFYSRD